MLESQNFLAPVIILEEPWQKTVNDEDDKTSAIETVIRFVLAWKKSGQSVRWDEAWETKEFLREELPIEDKYFESGRIIEKRLGKLTLDEVKSDFETYCKTTIQNQALGYLMKEKGFESKQSNGKTAYPGYTLSKASGNEVLRQRSDSFTSYSILEIILYV